MPRGRASTTRVARRSTSSRLDGLRRRASPRQLSGGQQQRVALARALVNRPAVLLLDEPLGALDLKLRKQMQVELKRIQREVGITFVYVTHDQEEALTMSDRIAVMNEGRVEQIGTPAESTSARRPVRRRLHRLANVLELTVDELVGAYAVARLRRGGARRRAGRLRPAIGRLFAWRCVPSEYRSDRPKAEASTAAHGWRERSSRSSTSACTRSSMSTRGPVASSRTGSPATRSRLRARLRSPFPGSPSRPLLSATPLLPASS